MKISIVSFTNRGAKLAFDINELMKIDNDSIAYSIEKFAKNNGVNPIEPGLKEWTKEHFSKDDALIFIGATGIAVRSIAPYVKSKTTDPAVIGIDEGGNFVISLLSGHIGGSNELSKIIADKIGARPVITTATDVNNTFAVDVFATKNKLYIDSMKYAKEIASAVLQKFEVGFFSDFSVTGIIPDAICRKPDGKLGIHVTLNDKSAPYEHTLHLIPRVVTLGVGCRKGKDFETINRHILDALDKNNISIKAIEKVATIDLKKEEAGLIKFCKDNNIEFMCYSAEELKTVKGEFNNSEFVKSVTGVDNVCERSAILGSNNGRIIQEKLSGDGVTVAIAIREWSVKFE